MSQEPSYVIAWFDLAEGRRLITNIIGCAVDDAKLGMKVTVQFEKASEKVWLPKFKPAVQISASRTYG